MKTISLNDMYLGEIAEIVNISEGSEQIKRLMDMGLREGKLIELVHRDKHVTGKVVVVVDNMKIAFDEKLASEIKVCPIKSYYEVFKNEAIFDTLTKCLNRRYFERILDFEIEKFKKYGVPLSLAIADIDYFKKINDKYGHNVGDKVLKEIAQIFGQKLRRSDVLCRWGGEEFLILLKGTFLNDAYNIAERLRIAVEQHFFNLLREKITVSFGVAGLPPPKDQYELIELADKYLYDAKKSGRNKVVIGGDL
ncbi:diguanylate cyclase [Thermodesulfovibrio hydrogeniphilus]